MYNNNVEFLFNARIRELPKVYQRRLGRRLRRRLGRRLAQIRRRSVGERGALSLVLVLSKANTTALSVAERAGPSEASEPSAAQKKSSQIVLRPPIQTIERRFAWESLPGLRFVSISAWQTLAASNFLQVGTPAWSKAAHQPPLVKKQHQVPTTKGQGEGHAEFVRTTQFPIRQASPPC